MHPLIEAFLTRRGIALLLALVYRNDVPDWVAQLLQNL